jgi:hypothetical protein
MRREIHFIMALGIYNKMISIQQLKLGEASPKMIISLKLTHVFRSKLTHPFTGGSVG